MELNPNNFFVEVIWTWVSGGWLMLPLLILTFFIYYSALFLWLQLEHHYLVQSGVHLLSDHEITEILDEGSIPLRQMLWNQDSDIEDVKRHFIEVSNEYLPPINRRIHFLGIMITIGPLMGLLGTVTGMLSTFDGMIVGQGEKFQNVVQGISEALITTQTGLIISIPGMAILSIIIQRRNRLRRSIARLERFNTCRLLRLGCPIDSTKGKVSSIGSKLPTNSSGAIQTA
ncbi:MotA/TolQ/ExbB proton channel family protein [Verrucomicrobia bacterium]|nr:MotA/TolQ/ExbB proton channel family protein [Verrucomicrobiota bacterium]